MCQTINTTIANNCPWASCGEWCLTKTGGFCTQIHATVRRNGTDIQLENCTRIATTACPQVCLTTSRLFARAWEHSFEDYSQAHANSNDQTNKNCHKFSR